MATKSRKAAEPAIPKTIGGLVDLIYQTQENRLAAQREVDAMEEKEKALIEHLRESTSAQDLDGAMGKLAKNLAGPAIGSASELVVKNIVENAIVYSAIGSKVGVSLAKNGSVAEIKVVDSGVGISKEDQKRIFERFYRTDPARSRETGGTGLGLSISLEDARLHNGELDAWGRPGKGAHFVLTLPRVAGEQIQGRPIKATPLDFHEENFYL
jgi:signal transduction histidine kinase